MFLEDVVVSWTCGHGMQKESWSDKTSSVPGGGEGTIKDEAKSAASGTASQPAVSATKADKMMTDPGQS